MRGDKKRFDNKHNFDAGRLDHKIEFFRYVSVNDGYGGVVVSEQLVLTTKCGIAPVSLNSLSQAQQIGMIGAETDLSSHSYFLIRNRNGFYPTKDMSVRIDSGQKYVINGIQKMDDPCTFVRVMASKSV